MPEFIITLINMSINAGWLVLAIILLRLLFRKAPKFIFVVMWALVGIRLIVPLSFESNLSLQPSGETIPKEIIYSETPEIHSGIGIFNSTVNPVISETFAPTEDTMPVKNTLSAFAIVWLIGLGVMLIYSVISYLLIKRKVRESVVYEKNVFLCDHIPSPFILGIFLPKIYLPSYSGEKEIKYIIAHEKAHLKRFDHLWKPLGFLMLSFYWFNPLLWVAYILLCRDIEGACDEKVIKTLGADIKKDYSTALVNFSHQRRIVTACPVAFGETAVKKRIKTILNYKKPVFWVIIVSVILVIALAIGFLTNPKSEIEIDDPLKVFIDCQIAEHHEGKYLPESSYSAIDYEILGTDEKSNEITVYMWVLYQEYIFTDTGIKESGGAHIPTVITAKNVNGVYQLAEYWEPRDGSYYVNDIKEKFPSHLHSKALDSQSYIKKQDANCLKMAEEYFKENISISNFGGADGPQSLTVEALKEKYPQYFDILTHKGVETYMWEENGKYTCVLTLGTNITKSTDFILGLPAISVDEARVIASTYDQSEIVVIPIKNPNFTEKIERLSGAKAVIMKHTFHRTLTRRKYLPTTSSTILPNPLSCDIDGDGKYETFSLWPGPTSGLFTVNIGIYENGKPEYYNTFNIEHFSEYYVDQSFGNYFVTRGTNDTLKCYAISFLDGNLVLTDESSGEMVSYWGEQGVDAYEHNYEIIESLKTVSWEYNPMHSYTGSSVFNIKFDCNQDKAVVVCNGGQFFDLYSSPQQKGDAVVLSDSDEIGWTPDKLVHEAPENECIHFSLYKDGHIKYAGEIYIYAYKKTDISITYHAHLSTDYPLLFSADGNGMKITPVQNSIKF